MVFAWQVLGLLEASALKDYLVMELCQLLLSIGVNNEKRCLCQQGKMILL